MSLRLASLMIATLLAATSVLPSAAFAKSGPQDFADMAEKLLPAVVNISTTQTIENKDVPGGLPDMPQFPPGSPFEQFFKDFMERHGQGQGGPQGQPGAPNAEPQKATSLGSGFIIDPAGYVVTNNHVVQDADEITVILQDDTNLKAKIVGRDLKVDLALLKVESKTPLPFVNFGDSDKMRVGDWVLAIGNPFGLGGTVTAGIISARARDIQSGPYDDYLQTDASINRGNSGGPMFDMDGNVIGINTAIFSPSGGSVGIGFAVPSSLAKSVVGQLKEYGHTKRGWLGVRIQQVTKDIAENLGLDKARGALVASLTPDAPAAKAGLEAGDIILTFDGKDVTEMRRLPRIVAETPVGKDAKLTYWRKGKELTTSVRVGELEQEEQKEASAQPSSPASAAKGDLIPQIGARVAALTPATRKRFELDDKIKGVVVTEITANGPAATKGIRPGDVIVDVARQSVSEPAEIADRVKEAAASGRKAVLMLLERGGDRRFVLVDLAETGESQKKDKR
jgi:serine protease Do